MAICSAFPSSAFPSSTNNLSCQSLISFQDKKMLSHPIHQANEKSPYGDLTREEFYKKHQILHQESFMFNKKKMKIFTQFWRPDDPTSQLKGIVAMVHGYSSESSWLNELTAIAIAKAGFLVCALDLQGHGYSDGLRGHIPNIQHVVSDCIMFFDSVKANSPNLPAFLYGESLGGAISILVCLKQGYTWDGLILSGAMCGISAKFKPMWPLEKLLPLAALFAPTWRVVASKPVSSRSYKEEWKRRMVANNPNRPKSGKPPAATALEFLRVCEYLRMHCYDLGVPFLMVHGEDDLACDFRSASFVYESASSKDKTLKIFPGMWHMLVGEPEESVELVFGTILTWLRDHAYDVFIKSDEGESKKTCHLTEGYSSPSVAIITYLADFASSKLCKLRALNFNPITETNTFISS